MVTPCLQYKPSQAYHLMDVEMTPLGFILFCMGCPKSPTNTKVDSFACTLYTVYKTFITVFYRIFASIC